MLFVWTGSLCFSVWKTASSINRNRNFLPSPYEYTLLIFLFLTTLARSSSATVNVNSDERWVLCWDFVDVLWISESLPFYLQVLFVFYHEMSYSANMVIYVD